MKKILDFSLYSETGENVGIAFLEEMANQHRKPPLLCVIQPMHPRTDQALHRRIENAIHISCQGKVWLIAATYWVSLKYLGTVSV